VTTRVAETVMAGGLNLSAPPLSLTAGEAIQLFNYEVTDLGRYKRIAGYERFDGRKRPSEQSYDCILLAGATTASVGATITGGTSGATGILVAIDAATNTLCLVNKAGTFVSNESAGGAVITSVYPPGTGGNDAIDQTFSLAVLAYFRGLITAVPGSGPVRGVVTYNGDVYAFRDNAVGDAGVMHKSTTAGWTAVTTPTPLVPGGRYQFTKAKFALPAIPATNPNNANNVSVPLLVGTDGKNKAFTFNGTTYTELSTGMSTDTPNCLAVTGTGILVLGYEFGSLMLSKIGDPTVFSAAQGGAEIALGDSPHSLITTPNNSMGVYCRRSVKVLYGTTPADMQLTEFDGAAGVYPHTVQPLGDPVFLSDQGVWKQTRVTDFGDFSGTPLSYKVDPLLERYRGKAVASFMVREKNQYRLCMDDGSGLIFTFAGAEVIGVSTFDFGKPVACAYSGDITGLEEIFFGTNDGFVYQAEKGNSLDGLPLKSVLRPAFTFIEGPEFRKRFKKVVMEVESVRATSLTIIPEFDYGGNNFAHTAYDAIAVGGGGYYDSALWDEVYWSTTLAYLVDMYLDGVGRNVSMVLFTDAVNETPHTVNSMLIHWSPRARRK
jgi:hypothetical protein